MHRIYREKGLQVRKCKKKRIGPVDHRQPVELPGWVNKRWSMDFMSDVLSSDTLFRILNIFADFSRECPANEVDTSLLDTRVVRVLKHLKKTRGLLKAIVNDTGPELVSKALDEWAYRNKVRLQFIEPGKQTYGNIVPRRCVYNVARDKLRIAVSPGMSYPM